MLAVTSLSSLLVTLLFLARFPSNSDASISVYLKCGACDVSRCPQLNYCEGKPIKDQCGCCTICSVGKFQPHITQPAKDEEDACEQLHCPRFKVCVLNSQRLPLCICPSKEVCSEVKQKDICGSDGYTYTSRCQMRIESCNRRIQIWKQYRGPCKANETRIDAATYRRKLKRLKRRRRKRRQRRKEGLTTERKDEEERKKKNRRRKRRKIGSRKKRVKTRTRRHRKTKVYRTRLLQNSFGRGTWNA